MQSMQQQREAAQREPTLSEWDPSTGISESNKSGTSGNSSGGTSPSPNAVIDINDEDGFYDSESWNWPVLCARIISFVVLFLILVTLCLGELNVRLFFLAALMAGALILIIIATYNVDRTLKVLKQVWYYMMCGCIKRKKGELEVSLV